MSEHADLLRAGPLKDGGGQPSHYPRLLAAFDDEDREAFVDVLVNNRVKASAVAAWLRDHPDVPHDLKVSESTIFRWRRVKVWEQ